MIVTTINVDFSKKGTCPIIGAVQSDQYSRQIKINLFNNGVPYVPNEGTAAVVSYKKVDEKGGQYDTLPNGETAWSIDGNSVTVAVAPQVCTVPGPVEFVVGLLNGEEHLYTFTIYLDVQPNPGLQVTSENYFKVTGALADSGWEPNKILGTDAEGNVIAVDAPEGTGGGGGGGYYTPVLVQLDSDNLRFTFNPSTVGMDPVDPVLVRLPPGANGDTPEKGVDYYTDEDKAEMVGAVMAELPITATEEGYTDIEGLRQATAIAFVQDGQTITATVTLEGGVTSTSVITLNAGGYPTTVVTDGVECAVSWEGF